MSWFILSLLALFSFVLYDLAGRYLATRSKNPQAFAIIYNLAVTILAPLLFVFDPTLPHDITPKVVFITILGLLVWGLFGRFEYFAKKHTEASTLTIVTKLDVILNFVLVIIFLGEKPTLVNFFGIGLIILANIILFAGHSWRKVISDQGLKYSLLIATLLAIGWVFDTINVKYWGVATFSSFSFLAPVIMSSFFPRINLSELKRELSLNPIWQILVMASLNLAGYAMMLKALTLGPATSVMPVVTSTSPFVVLFGYLVLKERDYPLRKLAAAILSVVAIYLMR
jgi:drug/metabolite transporter (DMT)-like permease